MLYIAVSYCCKNSKPFVLAISKNKASLFSFLGINKFNKLNRVGTNRFVDGYGKELNGSCDPFYGEPYTEYVSDSIAKFSDQYACIFCKKLDRLVIFKSNKDLISTSKLLGAIILPIASLPSLPPPPSPVPSAPTHSRTPSSSLYPHHHLTS